MILVISAEMKKVESFLLAYAQDFIAERFVYWSTKMGQDSLSLKFGFYKSKWGSCRRDTREIRLNGYLALCSPRMIDAVIVHELCHLKFPNHSSRFYQEVLFWFPDYYKEYKNCGPLKWSAQNKDGANIVLTPFSYTLISASIPNSSLCLARIGSI